MLANSFYSSHSAFESKQVHIQRRSHTMLPSIHHLPLPNFSEMALPPIKLNSLSSTCRYRCTVCSKSFNRKNSLVRHERIHSGLKPYSCKVCNKKFTRKDILEGHKLSIKCQRRTQYYSESLAFESSTTQNSDQFSTPPSTESSRRTSIASLLSSETEHKSDAVLQPLFVQPSLNKINENIMYY